LPHPRHEAALTIGTGLGFTCIFETTHKNWLIYTLQQPWHEAAHTIWLHLYFWNNSQKFIYLYFYSNCNIQDMKLHAKFGTGLGFICIQDQLITIYLIIQKQLIKIT
jgi:hypothetical protein